MGNSSDKRLFGIFADMAELADALDLGSSGQPCRFEPCYPHAVDKLQTLKGQGLGLIYVLKSEDIYRG